MQMHCFFMLLGPVVATAGESPNILDAFGLGQVLSWRESELHLRKVTSWHRIREPIGTVCVTGDDRVGKSTLLSMWVRNLTAKQDFNFPSASGWWSHTRGMWSAVLPPEATSLKYHLNLCDSQGLKQVADVEQWRLFAANVLIPQVLVYIVLNAVQNDQFRDLARMAHQFQKLSQDELGKLGRLLSPHLIVLVRDVSHLGEAATLNLTGYFEEAVGRLKFEEDKALINRVFRSREAWSLKNLPQEALDTLRSEEGLVQPWRTSGEVVLQRVLDALDRRSSSFPRGGPELAEWHQSVVETVNSEDDGSLGRLIGHGERLDLGRRRQLLLQDWFGPALATLGGLGLLVAFGGVIRVWLDRLAWLAWIVLCICYLGGSPLITTPLSGLVQRYCSAISVSTGEALVQAVCMEVSSQTAAIILASILGALSYPVLMSRFRWLLGHLPLNSAWQQCLATWCLVLLVMAAWRLQEAILEVAYGDTGGLWSLLGIGVLLVSLSVSSLDFLRTVEHNRRCALAVEPAMVLHNYIADRVEQVAALEASNAWATHYSRHAPRDAIWRYRSSSIWQSASNLTQACGLLAWAWLIHPSCDAALVAGVAANLMHLTWICSLALSKRKKRKDPLEEWLDELEDCKADDADAEASSSSGARSPPVQEETEEEEERRKLIEVMREEQEKPIHARKRKRNSSIPRRLSF